MRLWFDRNWYGRTAGLLGAVGLLLGVLSTSRASTDLDIPSVVSTALNENAPDRQRAVQELRSMGPPALQYLMAHPELKQFSRWSAVLDEVAQQKDAQYSGLYWYTDLDQALQVARRDHKPVLSLRLLGNLTDELSCANSRFFRTTLYPQLAVRTLLADQFVLHWQPVRSVPVITIDLGNGRTIKRTVTGNSAHMILDSQGRVVDLLPGLYGAGEFVRELTQIGPLATECSGLNDLGFQSRRAAFHAGQLEALQKTLNDELERVQLGTGIAGIDQDPATWSKLGGLYAAESIPRGTASQAVESKTVATAENANRRLYLKSVSETPLMKLVRNLGRSIGEDTVRNKYYLHAQIHQWFSKETFTPTPDQLLNRVYAELFLSPVDDPWFGLSRPDQFSAIAQDGKFNVESQHAGH